MSVPRSYIWSHAVVSAYANCCTMKYHIIHDMYLLDEPSWRTCNISYSVYDSKSEDVLRVVTEFMMGIMGIIFIWWFGLSYVEYAVVFFLMHSLMEMFWTHRLLCMLCCVLHTTVLAHSSYRFFFFFLCECYVYYHGDK